MNNPDVVSIKFRNDVRETLDTGLSNEIGEEVTEVGNLGTNGGFESLCYLYCNKPLHTFTAWVFDLVTLQLR